MNFIISVILTLMFNRSIKINWLLLSVLPVFLLNCTTAWAQDWKLNTERDGLKIYMADVPGSKIKALRVICRLQASESQLVAVLMDVNHAAEWVYHTKSCVLLKQVSPSELYYYSEINLPWPASNRDFIAHLTVTQDPMTRVVTIDGPVVNGMVPEKRGVVRIANAYGHWVISPERRGYIKIDYTLHTDPGGNLPAWIVNMFAAQGPLQFFEGLKREIQKPRYRSAARPYIIEKQTAADEAH